MNYKNLIIAIGFCIFFSLLFYIFPQIDIKTSALFYHHGMFFKPSWMLVVRHILAWVVWGLMIILLLLLFCGWLLRKKLVKPALFLVLCFALGPGLLVNVVLKNHWGRPRPSSIVRFGGELTYQRPWVISNQCATNCSFVAGDSSAAFTFFALVVLINIYWRKKFWRNLVFSLCALNWMFFSMIRLAAGGHFLSDILIGATLVWMVIWVCYWLVYHKGERI
ncbi:MAG: phosphatase PAP2 family protein [Gammaproteobacteria bacterium]|jgi:lipid A 4'-phosphatase